jgi:hypothetical protein
LSIDIMPWARSEPKISFIARDLVVAPYWSCAFGGEQGKRVAKAADRSQVRETTAERDAAMNLLAQATRVRSCGLLADYLRIRERRFRLRSGIDPEQ